MLEDSQRLFCMSGLKHGFSLTENFWDIKTTVQQNLFIGSTSISECPYKLMPGVFFPST